MKKNNFNMAVLDAYTKSLSSKQTEMLYENRMHKKFVPAKKLNEAFEPDTDKYFTTIVPMDAIKANGDDVVKLVWKIISGRDDFKYKVVTGKGVYFYTVMPADYETLIKELVVMGYADAIKDGIDPDFKPVFDYAVAHSR